MNTITTQCGQVVIPLQNILKLVYNSLCRTQQNTFVVVHNRTKKINLIFEPGIDDGTIQGCCFAIEKVGTEPLPFPLTISSYIPPINENL